MRKEFVVLIVLIVSLQKRENVWRRKNDRCQGEYSYTVSP
jgi:hypothetical protein